MVADLKNAGVIQNIVRCNGTTAEEKPLLNRAMRGIYPIGSTYKPFMALAGLELVLPSNLDSEECQSVLRQDRFQSSLQISTVA